MVLIAEANQILGEIITGHRTAPYPIRETTVPVSGLALDLDDTLTDTTDKVNQCRIYASQRMFERARELRAAGQLRETDHLVQLLENPQAVQDIIVPRLEGVVKRLGSNSDRHYNVLWEELGLGKDYFVDTIIAHNDVVGSGVQAYYELKERLWKPDEKVISLLRGFKEAGIALAVVTSALDDKKQLEKLKLTGLLDTGLFDRPNILIVCPKYNRTTGQYEENGGKADAFRQLIARLDIPAPELWGVGDRLSDAKSANEAGMSSVLYLNPTGRHSKSPTITSEPEIPHYAITRLEQLYTLIAQRKAA